MSLAWQHHKQSLRYLFRDRGVRLLSALIVLLGACTVVLETSTLQPRLAEQQNKLAHLHEIQQGVIRLEQRSRLNAQYDKVAPVVDGLDEKLTQRFGQSELTRALNRISASSGVEIVNINSRRDKPLEGYTITVSDISLRTSYPALRKLMASMDRLPGVNLLEGLSISRSSEGESLSVNLRMRTLGGAL